MSLRTLVGVILVVFGIGFLLDQLKVVNFGSELSTWWPVLLILAGATYLRRSIASVAGMALVLLGIILLVSNLGIIPNFRIERLWPLLIVLVGLRLILVRSGKTNIPAVHEDRISDLVMFSGIEARNNSSQFRGGDVTVLFGGAKIDLRDAATASDGAILDLTVAFGGIDLIVPRNWTVNVTGLPIFGGWENKTKPPGENVEKNMKLKVNCLAICGGIKIVNF